MHAYPAENSFTQKIQGLSSTWDLLIHTFLPASGTGWGVQSLLRPRWSVTRDTQGIWPQRNSSPTAGDMNKRAKCSYRYIRDIQCHLVTYFMSKLLSQWKVKWAIWGCVGMCFTRYDLSKVLPDCDCWSLIIFKCDCWNNIHILLSHWNNTVPEVVLLIQ